MGSARASGALVLGDLAGRTIAYVADEDDKVVHVLDVAGRQEIASTQVAGTPAQVLVASDGRVLVTLRDASLVQVFTASNRDGSLTARCTVPTSIEPIGIAEAPGGASFVVTSGWGRAVTVLDAHTRRVVWRSNSSATGMDGVVFFGLGRVSTAGELACLVSRGVVARLFEPPKPVTASATTTSGR